MESFWTRTEMLIGAAGRKRLAAARVAVIGTGGVGSFAVEGLARAGVGYLELVDPDVVKPSNLNRQLPALGSTLGQPKVAVLAARCRDINPEATIIPRQEAYSPATSLKFVRPDLDFLVDAIDSVKAKIDLLATAVTAGRPIVSSMGAGNRLDPTLLRVADISATRGCPLARAVRRGLRARGIAGGLTVVYSEEPPLEIRTKPQLAPGERQPPGSMIFVPAVAGLILANLVVRALLQGDSYSN
ncbi:dinucleotide-utilizing enzymes [Moorella thermoacetica Y72]|uniref:Dinucleotide-utilizing enzymes n=2 Tax=Neomoorella thermoacetica TaxID=1525 RepID=A0A0S6U962_NEOTH|nr:tRNA threonylcarbamoyladenosine dehydratase [Moorella thermoacetica]APC08871.1 tRNA threonylcarbamoyladenosine dehydratase [Moorella thermoacetica]GAF24804.1 dinucleotide-utilizing enzymes [Moorella thermoacetica Y72]